MFILSGFRLWLPAAFALGGRFRRNGSMDSRIIEIRVVIPPAVIRLFGDLTGSQPGGLLLPGTETLLQISRMDAAIKNLRTQTDQTICPSSTALGVRFSDSYRASLTSAEVSGKPSRRPQYCCVIPVAFGKNGYVRRLPSKHLLHRVIDHGN